MSWLPWIKKESDPGIAEVEDAKKRLFEFKKKFNVMDCK
jgi:hypothetical protein